MLVIAVGRGLRGRKVPKEAQRALRTFAIFALLRVLCVLIKSNYTLREQSSSVFNPSLQEQWNRGTDEPGTDERGNRIGIKKGSIFRQLKWPIFPQLASMDNKTVTKQGFFRAIVGSLRPAFTEFQKNDPLRMAGATAFFTTFALPPILFIIIQLLGLFMDQRNIGRALFVRVSNTLGEDGASQVRQVLRGIRGFSDSWLVIIAGTLFLLFVATTLFTVIKNSLNQIWMVSIQDHPGFFSPIKARIRALFIIILAGVLFLADVMIDGLQIMAGDFMDEYMARGSVFVKPIISQVVGATVIAAWFIILFRFLADGRPTWKAAAVGGVLTGIFFTTGKLLLLYLLVHSNVGRLFGTAGSFVLVLLFVFYSSFILYYGASFIHTYSARLNLPITPTSKAFAYTLEEVE